MPGCNHAICVGDSSNDQVRQLKYAETVIQHQYDQAIAHDPAPKDPSPDPSSIKTEPYCFVADTNSVQYIVDTGANRVIVNDINLLRNVRMMHGTIK